jgi:hypothetical protein
MRYATATSDMTKAQLTLLRNNFSRAMRRKPRNHYNVSQPDSSTSEAFARYPLSPRRHGAVAPMGGCLCVSSFLCSPLFSSYLLPRPVLLALLRRSLRLRPRPAPSISSGSRRYFVRNWQATARPRVSGSAISSSATPIASNVIVLSADPFGSQSPPLGNLGRAFVFAWGSGRWEAVISLRSLTPRPVVGDDRQPTV